ncbi:MAG: ferric enterobactin receptor [Cyclobacteriaceae bacterium]|jgi:ferric enterobactin receptor
MKNLFLCSISFCIVFTALAQRPVSSYSSQAKSSIKGKITGALFDENDNSALEFATVAVKDKASGKVVNGGLTESDGAFKLSDLNVGTYDVEFSFVGYTPITLEVELTLKKPDVDLGKIAIVPDLTALSEVVVEGQREVFENKIDRLVYNAEQDIGNTGGDATDVLRRTPLLRVDLEGNVSLRGSSNIQILVNGKPSTMFASNPGDALAMIASDNIKSVEVITSPSAKYDGEGTAGIINIITKKAGPEGFNGNINLSAGNLSNRGVAGLATGKGRFGFNANASGNWSVPRDGTSMLYREDNIGEEQRVLEENGIQETQRLGFFLSAGAFYDINAYNSFTSSFRLRGFSSDRIGTFATSYEDTSIGLNQDYERFTDNQTLFSGYEWSLDYIHKFAEQEGRELSFSYKIDGNVQDQRSVIRQTDLSVVLDPTLFRDELNQNDGNNQETTYQVDYVHPFSAKIKLEMGAKAIVRNVDSDFEFDTLNQASSNYQAVDGRTDVFFYDQDVYSAYISSQFSLPGDIGIIAGLRYEGTELAGRFVNVENAFSNDYENLLPSFTISKTFNKTKTFKMSYSKRIQRPGLRQINPFVIVDNNRLISYGNPELEPELNDQYEISFNTFKKESVINLSVFYRVTTDLIESIRLDNQTEVTETSFFNVGTNNSLGVNVFASTKLFKIWTMRAGVDAFTYDATGQVNGEQLSNSAILFNANGSGTIQLKKDWTIEGFGFFRARRQTLQGYNPSFSIWSLTLQKEIWDKKGKIGIRVVEPLKADKSFGSELSGENFYQISDFTIPFRSYGLTFSYKFGKQDFRQRQRRSKINNNDQEGVSEPNF